MVGEKYANFQTDADKLNILVYRYRSKLYLKVTEIVLEWTTHQSLLPKRVSIELFWHIFQAVRCTG